MLTLNDNANFKLVREVHDEDNDVFNYTCDFTVDCECGIVRVIELNIINSKRDWVLISAIHDKDFVYGDTAFENAISAIVNADVQFTESGMQEEGYASLETYI